MDKLIEQGIKVDMILADLPYGTTACKWDSVIQFNELWDRYKKLAKLNAAIVLFGTQPFTTHLIMSNIKNFKYQLIWNKKNTGCPVVAKKRPLPIHEDINVFSYGKIEYNPIKTGTEIRKWKQYKNSESIPIAHVGEGECVGKYPKSILEFSNADRKNKVHPTQKPVELIEYLIKLYTKEGDTILDNTVGSGTTLIACKNTNRNGIGIEIEEKYYEIAKNRLLVFEWLYIGN